jgi:hypothetical protein
LYGLVWIYTINQYLYSHHHIHRYRETLEHIYYTIYTNRVSFNQIWSGGLTLLLIMLMNLNKLIIFCLFLDDIIFLKHKMLGHIHTNPYNRYLSPLLLWFRFSPVARHIYVIKILFNTSSVPSVVNWLECSPRSVVDYGFEPKNMIFFLLREATWVRTQFR